MISKEQQHIYAKTEVYIKNQKKYKARCKQMNVLFTVEEIDLYNQIREASGGKPAQFIKNACRKMLTENKER